MRMVFVLLLLTGVGLAYNPPEPVVSSPSTEKLDELVKGWLEKTKIPGLALARIDKGQVAWVKVYGEAAAGKPVTPKTPFNVASLTKPVFGLLVLHLVAKSALDLDAPLATHWVDPDVEGDPRVNLLTARMALSHQTGFPNWRGRNTLAFQFDPGKGTDYSGEGYEFLLRAIEKATGKTLPQLMEDLVKSAGMQTASFGWSEGLRGNLAIGYDESGAPIPGKYLEKRGPAAASSLFCSIEDYANFTAWVSRGADLPKKLFEEMQRDQALHQRSVEAFGLGWRLVAVQGTKVLTHDGREDGVRTLVYVEPSSGSGFVLLCNGSNGELLTRPLTQEVLPNGAAIMDAMDENAYQYALTVPSQVQPKMLNFIARSPAFVSKLLHGAEMHLIRRHFPRKKDQLEIQQAVSAIVLAHLEGRRSADEVHAFFKTMGTAEGETFSLASSLTKEEASQWRTRLLALAK